jgi:ribokinase
MYPTRRQIGAIAFEDIGWVHTAVYDHSAAELLIGECRVRAIPWSLDLEPSTFPDGLDRLRDFIDGAAVVFCNARSAERIGEEPVQRLFAMGANAIVRTHGADGATLHGANSNLSFPAPRSVAIDTTGAGDCLAGWFVAERLRGAASDEALKTAIAAATISCGRLGGQSSYPTREEVAISAA